MACKPIQDKEPSLGFLGWSHSERFAFRAKALLSQWGLFDTQLRKLINPSKEMKNFIHKNWFKLLVLLILVVGLIFLIYSDYEPLNQISNDNQGSSTLINDENSTDKLNLPIPTTDGSSTAGVNSQTSTNPSKTEPIDGGLKIAQCEAEAKVKTDEFQTSLNIMSVKLKQQNPLLARKNLIIKAMGGSQLTNAELSTLPPETVNAINANDTSLLNDHITLLNDQIAKANIKIDQDAQTQKEQYYNKTYSDCLES